MYCIRLISIKKKIRKKKAVICNVKAFAGNNSLKRDISIKKGYY